ncbi:hypothetical protein KBB27_04680 [Patescibacteria group bacterium]|nr:hypothetical protein [Patescibacteria group bacterium]
MKLRTLLYKGAAIATVAIPAFGNVASAAPSPFATNSTMRRDVGTIAGNAGLSSSGTATLPQIIGNIINIALGFMGILLLVYLIYAGFLWMTSTDSKGPDKAKEMIKNAIVGLIIIVSAFAISGFVMNALVNVTNPAGATA